MHRVFYVEAGYDFNAPEYVELFKKQSDANKRVEELKKENKYFDYCYYCVKEVK